jgi:hypothetical protein
LLRRLVTVTVASALVLPLGAAASATPVAKTREERKAMGRTFLEPLNSTDFIQHGPEAEPEFEQGFSLLADMFPRYARFTTIDKELKDPNAVSVGPDGFPAWDKRDTGDGLPFQVATVTDFSVPDRNKGYVLFTNAHGAEPCGREGAIRFMEDLIIWATNDPDHELNDASGITGKEHVVTVREALKKTKIYFVDVAPDGWAAGDNRGQYSQSNGAGINNNRVAYQDGWVFPPDQVIYKNGYSVLTQPEGAAVTKYLTQIRRRELGGKPWAVAADMHGPLPVGAILLHDQGNTAAKLVESHDLAERIKQKMDKVLASYITEYGLTAHETVAEIGGTVRDAIIDAYERVFGGFPEKAAFLTLKWAEYATIWEHIDYTVSGSFGGWANSNAGLGATSISFEIDCLSYEPWNPALMQLFVENIQAIDEASVVYAATRNDRIEKEKVGGTIGFYESGERVTDKDGNASPPPPGFPNNPIVRQIRQVPYDVSNTDYFRDLDEIVKDPIVEMREDELADGLGRLDSLVISDTSTRNTKALRDFVNAGGNLILTDGALTMLDDLTGMDGDAVRKGYAYVGYSDLDREHRLTRGLYDRARQMFDPIGLGYELLMERDQYWPCDPNGACEESPTRNSAPIWTVQRPVWEASGGITVGTADPPEDRKLGTEGKATDKTNIGILKMGKGRIVIFGALLPQPTEKYPHWFGLDAYTISVPGQQLLLNALRR